LTWKRHGKTTSLTENGLIENVLLSILWTTGKIKKRGRRRRMKGTKYIKLFSTYFMDGVA
jgi:hypothetical protein